MSLHKIKKLVSVEIDGSYIFTIFTGVCRFVLSSYCQHNYDHIALSNTKVHLLINIASFEYFPYHCLILMIMCWITVIEDEE